MQVFPFGKVTVATAGTSVPLSSVLPAGCPTKVHRIIVSQVFGSTGEPCFGTTAVVASTGVGVIKQFAQAGSTGLLDTYVHEGDPGNELNIEDYALDVTVNGTSLFVSAVIG